MKVKNELKIKVQSHSYANEIVLFAIREFLAQQGIDNNTIEAIKIVVSEAITNCIKYAYPNSIGQIKITATSNEKLVKVTIVDKGCGIPDIKQARVAFYTTDEQNGYGLGFTVMEAYADKITVRSTINKGTSVTLTKKITTEMPCNQKEPN